MTIVSECLMNDDFIHIYLLILVHMKVLRHAEEKIFIKTK